MALPYNCHSQKEPYPVRQVVQDVPAPLYCGGVPWLKREWTHKKRPGFASARHSLAVRQPQLPQQQWIHRLSLRVSLSLIKDQTEYISRDKTITIQHSIFDQTVLCVCVCVCARLSVQLSLLVSSLISHQLQSFRGLNYWHCQPKRHHDFRQRPPHGRQCKRNRR